MKKQRRIKHLKNMGLDVWLKLDATEVITNDTNQNKNKVIKSIELCDDCNTSHKYSNHNPTIDSVDLLILGDANEDYSSNQAHMIKLEKLLENIIYSIGIRIEKVSKVDVCCVNFLNRKIEEIQPSRILVFDPLLANRILGTNDETDILRECQHELNGILLYVTFNLVDILNNPDLKRLAWKDLCLLRKDMENK